MNRVMYLEWFPRDHVRPPSDRACRHRHVRPAVPRSVQLQLRSAHPGSARSRGRGDAQPLCRGRKPGVTSRKGSNYSTWWNGGLRTMAYFHNMIGLLTETIGNPTPMRSRSCRSGTCPIRTCISRSRRRNGTPGGQSITRSPRTGRCSTSPPGTRRASSDNIADGEELD